MRYERKYRIEGMSLPAVKQMLQLHPASFRTLYPDRQVNNIYFDTPTLTTFHQNVGGDQVRKKFRVRWYGKDAGNIRQPQFEIKAKMGELGSKQVQPVSTFQLDDLNNVSMEVNRLTQFETYLKPTLLNAYGRSYLISHDSKFRLTIDYALAYHSLLRTPDFHGYLVDDPAIILEIKYEAEDDARVSHITQHLPFRQSRHSKYVHGIQLTR